MDPLVHALTQHLTVTGRTRILDAVAGRGARLVEIAGWLAERPAYKTRDEPRRAALDSLYGVSDDTHAVTSALVEWARSDAGPVHVSSGDPLAFAGEAVQGELFGTTPDRRPPDVFEAGPFDAVIADIPNHPIALHDRDRLRDSYESAVGRFTYEAVFAERVTGLVADGGVLVIRVRLAVLRRDFGRVLATQVLSRGEILDVDADGDRVTIVLRRGNHVSSASIALIRALGGRQVARVLQIVESNARRRLGDLVEGAVGRTSTPGCDEIWEPPPQIVDAPVQPMVRGEDVHEWRISANRRALWPYDDEGRRLDIPPQPLVDWLTNFRPYLEARRFFGRTLDERGLRWFEYIDHHPRRWASTPTLVIRRAGTWVRAALVRNPIVVSGTALALTPRDERSAAVLLGVLTSSVGNLWCKQHFHVYETADGKVFEATTQGLAEVPIPSDTETIVEIARRCDVLGRSLIGPESVVAGDPERLGPRLDGVRGSNARVLRELKFWEEELDWAVYAAFGLTDIRDVRTYRDDLPVSPVSELDEIPSDEILARRWEALQASEELGALEDWEYKRRWVASSPAAEEADALREWIVARIDAAFRDEELPADRPVSVEEVHEQLGAEPVFSAVLTRLEESLDDVLLSASIPFEATRTYSSSGLHKLQDRALGDPVTFTPEDYSSRGSHAPHCSPTSHRRRIWGLRGRYGVPRERFVHLADLSEVMEQPLFGWAGATDAQRERLADLVAAEGAVEQLDLEQILSILDALRERPGSTTAELAQRVWARGMSYREVRLALGVLEGGGAARAINDRWELR